MDVGSAKEFLDELDLLLDAGHPFGLVLDLGRFDRGASQLVTEWLGERFERCASTIVAMSTVVAPATIAASRNYIDAHPESYPCACDVGASVSECAEWVRARLIERGQ